VREIARIAHTGGALFHTDAVQTFGQMDWTTEDLDADLISLSSHKIYGPKGVGALYVRTGVSIEPWLHGGAQERGRRAGTENVAGIAGFAAAIQKMLSERTCLARRLTAQREGLIRMLQEQVPCIVLNGHPSERLPNNLNISIPGGDAETLLLTLDRQGVSASSGSACTSGSIEPSHVLIAMGLPKERTASALRLTVGRSTTDEELRKTAQILQEIIERQGTV
jgi:cysteine desulfurase